jgi:hypothetical protein
MSVQTSYSESMRKSLPGVVEGCDFDADTGLVETVLGIGFGLAVSQGANSDQGIIIGGTRVGFIGVTIRDVTLESDDADVYQQYANAGVLRRGTIWVAPTHSVAAGDAVYFVAATGALTNQSGGNQGPINGARWRTAAAGTGDVALLELSGYQRSA